MTMETTHLDKVVVVVATVVRLQCSILAVRLMRKYKWNAVIRSNINDYLNSQPHYIRRGSVPNPGKPKHVL